MGAGGAGEGGGGGGGGDGAGGGGPKMPDIGALMTEIAKIQYDAERVVAEGSAGGGMVVVTVNGKNEILKVKIEREVVEPDDVQMLEDLVRAATNGAIRNAQEKMREEVAKLAAGFGLPPGLLG
jgi:DNA-binding YbaB/EbfC family protein